MKKMGWTTSSISIIFGPRRTIYSKGGLLSVWSEMVDTQVDLNNVHVVLYIFLRCGSKRNSACTVIIIKIQASYPFAVNTHNLTQISLMDFPMNIHWVSSFVI